MERLKQKLEEARKQREQIQAVKVAIVDGMRYPPKSILKKGKPGLFTWTENRWYFSTPAMIIMSVLIAWLVGTGRWDMDYFSDDKQKIASKTTPEQMLYGEISHTLETLPAPAAGQTLREANVPAAVTPEIPTARESNKIAPEKAELPTQTTETIESVKERTNQSLRSMTSVVGRGLWVINLASLSSKADANRFSEMAREKGIETEQQQVTVKRKQYWRVQITGFSTAAEARTSSDDVKEILGLQDVWITTR